MVRVASAALAFPICKTGALLLNYTRKTGFPAWTRTTTIRLTVGHATLTSPGILVPSAGLAPAPCRLEDGCALSYTTRAESNGRAGESRTRFPVFPKHGSPLLRPLPGHKCVIAKMADATGAAPALSGSTDRQLCCSLSRPWWELAALHHSSASGPFNDGGFTDH